MLFSSEIDETTVTLTWAFHQAREKVAQVSETSGSVFAVQSAARQNHSVRVVALQPEAKALDYSQSELLHQEQATERELFLESHGQ